jgi:hypothetical protein
LPKYRHRQKTISDIEKDPQHIREAELMNRVILAKCVMAVVGKQPVTLKTKDEGEFVITPQIARKLMRMAESKSHEKRTN